MPTSHKLLRADNRRYRRRIIHLRARLDLGGGRPLRDCMLIDVSEMGARLALHVPAELPDEFTLLLSPSGFPSRRCRLVWRAAEQIGVEFDWPLAHFARY